MTATPIIRKVMHPERTRWGRTFKRTAPYDFAEALTLVSTLTHVSICEKDDHSFKGDYLWAVIPNGNPEFWLDALPTLDEAKRLCRIMGWPILEIRPAASNQSDVKQTEKA